MNFVYIGCSILSLNVASHMAGRAGGYVWEKIFPPREERHYQRIMRALEQLQNENRVWHDLSEREDPEFEDIVLIEHRE